MDGGGEPDFFEHPDLAFVTGASHTAVAGKTMRGWCKPLALGTARCENSSPGPEITSGPAKQNRRAGKHNRLAGNINNRRKNKQYPAAIKTKTLPNKNNSDPHNKKQVQAQTKTHSHHKTKVQPYKRCPGHRSVERCPGHAGLPGHRSMERCAGTCVGTLVSP